MSTNEEDGNPVTSNALSVMKALGKILRERNRQIKEEGWSIKHDDAHTERQLSRAAASYLVTNQDIKNEFPPVIWPWEMSAWNPKDYKSNLIRAGALILAEIERLDRAERRDALKELTQLSEEVGGYSELKEDLATSESQE